MLLAPIIWVLTVVVMYFFAAKVWWFPPPINQHGLAYDAQFMRTLVVTGIIFFFAQFARKHVRQAGLPAPQASRLIKLEPLTRIELVTFRYGRSTKLATSPAPIKRCRSAIPARLFKKTSLALAPLASSNSSRAMNSHG